MLLSRSLWQCWAWGHLNILFSRIFNSCQAGLVNCWGTQKQDRLFINFFLSCCWDALWCAGRLCEQNITLFHASLCQKILTLNINELLWFSKMFEWKCPEGNMKFLSARLVQSLQKINLAYLVRCRSVAIKGTGKKKIIKPWMISLYWLRVEVYPKHYRLEVAKHFTSRSSSVSICAPKRGPRALRAFM